MSALPYTPGLPTPNPSPSGTGIKKGVFPPRPKSVRVWAVIDHARPQESSEPASTATPPGCVPEQPHQSGQGSTGASAKGLPKSVYPAVFVLVLVVLAVIVLAAFL